MQSNTLLRLVGEGDAGVTFLILFLGDSFLLGSLLSESYENELLLFAVSLPRFQDITIFIILLLTVPTKLASDNLPTSTSSFSSLDGPAVDGVGHEGWL